MTNKFSFTLDRMYGQLFTIDQLLYSLGAALPGPIPGPLSPPQQTTVQDPSNGLVSYCYV